jgi:hypothetical protein
MNKAQRDSYFGWRWPAACRGQGWDRLSKEEREKKRHQVTLEASGMLPGWSSTDSITKLDQDQITALFNLLKHYANPNSLKHAVPVANPAEEKEKDERRRAAFSLSQRGLTNAEIQNIAEPLCRRHRVGDWRLLPSKVIREMMVWKQFNKEEVAKRRRNMGLPLIDSQEDAPIIYHLKASPRPCGKGPL